MPTKAYNREKAVRYAHKWAHGRNPKYYDFSPLGGDCTNFASQVLYAGSGVMNYTPVLGWYYIDLSNRSPSWTGVQFLYNFLVTNSGAGPFGEDTDVERMLPGDLIQLSFDGRVFTHSLIVVSAGSPAAVGNILIAAHTFNADNRPLSSYRYQSIRFVHIRGVNS